MTMDRDISWTSHPGSLAIFSSCRPK